MSKHTPGPWHIGQHQKIISTGWSIRIPTDGSAIAYVLGERNPELQANARLIAAAPDLLESLQTMVKAFKTYAPTTEGAEYNCVIQARAAIAKATGEQA